jgi:hypothetical protein
VCLALPEIRRNQYACEKALPGTQSLVLSISTASNMPEDRSCEKTGHYIESQTSSHLSAMIDPVKLSVIAAELT